MIEDKLQLPVGTLIQLQQDGIKNPARYSVKLLGYYPGKALIVTNTEFQGRTVLQTDDTAMIARALQGSVCQAFAVKVIQTMMVPFPHLYLTYPNDIETSVVRNANRIVTKQPALVSNGRDDDGKRYEALVVDLSSSGAKVATKVPVAEVNDVLDMIMELEVAGKDERITVAATVKSVEFKDGDKAKGRLPLFYYGLMFEGINRFQQIIIHAYVMEFSMKVKL